MASPEAKNLTDRIVLGLSAQTAAEDREGALVEAARDRIAPLPGETRSELRGMVQQVGESGDLNLILEIEKRLLAEELQNRVAAPGQATALQNALKDLEIAADLVSRVRDPDAYWAVAADHRRDRNKDRIGAPLDEARQFFNSHAARLTRAVSALGQGDASEKQLLAVRRGNISAAHKLYRELQGRALGIEGADSGSEGDLER